MSEKIRPSEPATPEACSCLVSAGTKSNLSLPGNLVESGLGDREASDKIEHCVAPKKDPNFRQFQVCVFV